MIEQVTKWLINFPSTHPHTKMNLICFPFAGGGTVNYARWRAELNPEINLYALNLPGRERFFGQPNVTDFHALIKALANLLSTQLNVSMVFFGHSFGALTAYFIALELKKMNHVGPNHIIISARRPPELSADDLISGLSQEQFKSVLIERYQGIPQQVLDSPDLLNLFLPIIQKDFILYEQFPQVFAFYKNEQVDCDITTIRYTEDSPTDEVIKGWKKHTTAAHQHIELPGGHFKILSDWKDVVAYINRL